MASGGGGGGGDFGSGSVTTDDRQKRLKTEPPDRLSALPDSLLLHILSLLPTNQATQTASLSKRWLRLWHSVPSLTFSQHQIKTRKFISSINRTLAQSTCPEINKFSVRVAYKPKFAPDISRWIAFAIGRNVQEIDLELKNFDYYKGYDLPQEIFTGLSIRKLRLSECDIAPVGVISWRLLKNLSIEHSHLSGDVIRKISTGCPVLESLVLNECHVVDGITRVEIDSISLSELVINGYWDPFKVDESLLEVSAPNVRFLEITGDWGKKGVKLVNVSSLFDVKLDFVRLMNIGDDRDNYKQECDTLFDVVSSLGHVKRLMIGSWCIMVLSMLELKGSPLPRSQRRYLTIDAEMRKWELPGIAALLQSSPDVENLVINLKSSSEIIFSRTFTDPITFVDSYNFDGEDYWTSRLLWVLKLKSVKISRFWTSYCRYTFSFVEVLLKHALALEKLVLDVPSFFRSGDMVCCLDQSFEQVEELLSLPRYSRKAVILFSRQHP
ncbi:hypothetical protein RJ640_017640 [Escallonia rubra]|uniref:F-box domain-containing protein n=1 Tax=Escallonia rubra TaxID=112253 RepID=A0AA88UCN2_9ASTE|nr:hypothetical protein RJ640_017640 [Escallonia rubra]